MHSQLSKWHNMFVVHIWKHNIYNYVNMQHCIIIPQCRFSRKPCMAKYMVMAPPVGWWRLYCSSLHPASSPTESAKLNQQILGWSWCVSFTIVCIHIALDTQGFSTKTTRTFIAQFSRYRALEYPYDEDHWKAKPGCDEDHWIQWWRLLCMTRTIWILFEDVLLLAVIGMGT